MGVYDIEITCYVNPNIAFGAGYIYKQVTINITGICSISSIDVENEIYGEYIPIKTAWSHTFILVPTPSNCSYNFTGSIVYADPDNH